MYSRYSARKEIKRVIIEELIEMSKKYILRGDTYNKIVSVLTSEDEIRSVKHLALDDYYTAISWITAAIKDAEEENDCNDKREEEK